MPQGLCDIGALRTSLKGRSRSLVFMDIEGGEALLLDPAVIPELKQATLWSKHMILRFGTDALIRERFAQTHQIVEISPKDRTAEDFPKLGDTPFPFCSEGRPFN